MRLVRSLVAIAAAVILSISTASAAELMMFRLDGCLWCAAWDRDIGPIYGKTDIGRRAPLRMVNIRSNQTEISLKIPVVHSPTFVLIDNGREVGRIEGYSSDQFFWGLLEGLMQKLPHPASRAMSPLPSRQ